MTAKNARISSFLIVAPVEPYGYAD